MTWPASPAEDLRLEIGGSVAHPGASAQAELVLSLLGALGAPPVGASPGRAGPRPGAGPSGAGGERSGDRLARYLWGKRLLDPAWPAGPGAAVLEGLSPGTTYDIAASARGVPTFLAGRLRTLERPGGRLLSKFATVSDLHIGEKNFGVMGRIHDGCDIGPAETYPVRALRAAMAEAAAWGAELVVVKGDLTRLATAAEVRDAGQVLATSSVPIETILGNHDNQLSVDIRAVLESQGIRVSWQPLARDLPGLRLVLANTPHGNPHYHRGHLPAAATRQIAALTSGAPAGAWVGLHHPPEMHRYPTVYPPGIPFEESRALLDALAAAKPATLVTCGHRHRNRRYDYGPLVITEVGSTKDYPGGWAGYKVFEGGIIQIVRRTARPDVISWTETTRRAVNGQWRRWSPGRLDDRCFALHWSR